MAHDAASVRARDCQRSPPYLGPPRMVPACLTPQSGRPGSRSSSLPCSADIRGSQRVRDPLLSIFVKLLDADVDQHMKNQGYLWIDPKSFDASKNFQAWEAVFVVSLILAHHLIVNVLQY
ncbi:hypothetical protein AURDEDRAFT_161663 [Auricularia subglabra TFB-10046 SS5]|nr:hypothetical protein AURDEDRAFT_161663 [Auricularia subglabra TFB-10046 SS5]